jgi:hypothetical protein
VGGAVITLFSRALSLLAPIRNRILLWLPAFSFFTLAVLKLGYMPSYMLLPLNVLLVLPVAAALAYAGSCWVTSGPVPVRIAAGAFLVVLCAVNAWAANYAWALCRFKSEELEERYVRSFVSKQELVNVANLWTMPRGALRLACLGYNIDNRSVMELMSRPDPMPDVVLIHVRGLGWLEDLKRLPARNRMLAEAGYFYAQFPGFEALGYRLAEKYSPTLAWPLNISWIPRWVRMWYPTPEGSEIFVYRKVVPTTSEPSAAPAERKPQ